MLKTGNTYIPFHAVNQITFEKDVARIWWADSTEPIVISVPEDVERLKVWLAEKPALTLGE